VVSAWHTAIENVSRAKSKRPKEERKEERKEALAAFLCAFAPLRLCAFAREIL
jgi:hypothetical protein